MVLLAPEREVGLVYPDSTILAEFLMIPLKRSSAFWSHGVRRLWRGLLIGKYHNSAFPV